MQKKYKKLFTDAGLFAASNFSSKILTVLLVPVYTSVLTTKEYGMIDVFATTVNLLYPVLTLSISDATLRFALDRKYDNKAVFSTSMLLMGGGIVFVLLLLPFLGVAGGVLGEYRYYFVGVFATTALRGCLSNYVKGCGKTRIYAIQGILNTAVFLTLNIWFLLLEKKGLSGYFLSMILSSTISCIYMLLVTKAYLEFFSTAFDKEICKEMLAYSVPMIPSTVAWWVNASADKYMILSFVGMSANGLYGVAHKIPSIFTTFSSFFSQAWRISAISAYDDKDRQEYYAKVYKMYSLVCVYGCVAIVFSSQIIAKILFKEDYYQAWVLVPPLVVAALFEACSGFLASIYAAAKQTKFLSVSTCVGAVANIVLNYILIKSLGMIGAPIATMISFAVVWLMRLKVLNFFVPISIDMTKMIVSIAMVVIGSIYYMFQLPLKCVAGIIVVIAIVLMNTQDTKTLCKLFCNATRSIIRRKAGGK